MGGDFEAGVCEGKWWNPSQVEFGSSSINLNDHISLIRSYGWADEMVEVIGGEGGGRSSEDSSEGNDDSIDLSLQMIGIGLPLHSSTDWNQSLIHGNVIHEEDLNYYQEKPPENNLSTRGCEECFLNSYSYPSTLLQPRFDKESPLKQSLFEAELMDYSANIYRTSLSEFSPFSLPKLSHKIKRKQEISANQMNTHFWNRSSSVQSQLLPSTFEEKHNCVNFTAKFNQDETRKSVPMKNACSEHTFKRPRLQTPSPLPTFMVRKEKLGDRITALQQLVSPFGKTDTASVLHEAIDYIKLLHDQVNVLSSPYLKNGASIQYQQNPVKVKEREDRDANEGLKSRGLCLVPVSSTFPLAVDTTTDLWTPSFGATFH